MLKKIMEKVRNKRSKANNEKIIKEFIKEKEKFIKTKTRLNEMALKLKEGKIVQDNDEQSVAKEQPQEQQQPNPFEQQQEQQQPQQQPQPMPQMQQPQPMPQMQQPQPMPQMQQPQQNYQQPPQMPQILEVSISMIDGEVVKVQVPTNDMKNFVNELDTSIADATSIRLGNLAVNGRHIIKYQF